MADAGYSAIDSVLDANSLKLSSATTDDGDDSVSRLWKRNIRPVHRETGRDVGSVISGYILRPFQRDGGSEGFVRGERGQGRGRKRDALEPVYVFRFFRGRSGSHWLYKSCYVWEMRGCFRD